MSASSFQIGLFCIIMMLMKEAISSPVTSALKIENNVQLKVEIAVPGQVAESANTTKNSEEKIQVASVRRTLVNRMLEGASGHKNKTIPLLQANGLLYKRYHFLTDKKVNFDGAASECSSKGYGLASIEDQQEFALLSDHLKKHFYPRKNSQDDKNNIFWTSGNDLTEKGVYFWKSTGKPILSHRSWWRSYEPNHEEEDGVPDHCLSIKFDIYEDAKLYDRACNLLKYPICEEYVDEEKILKKPKEYFYVV